MTTTAKARLAQAGLVTGPVGYVVAQVPIDYAQPVGWGALVAGVGMVSTATWSWYSGRRATTSHINRWSRRSRRNQGTQSLRDHLKETSSLAMRRRARALRPSYAALSRLELIRASVEEYAAPLGKSGHRTIWVAHEDAVIRVAGPRSGKTAALGVRINRHRGPALVTSTRVDLLRCTRGARGERGPLLIFNPAGVGGYSSTLKWSPLVGCTSPAIARRRAADMIPGTRDEQAETWNVQARRILAPMMMAAAKAGASMRTVLKWLSASGEDAKKAGETIAHFLKQIPDAAAEVENIKQFYGMTGENERTRSSIVTTLLPTLNWLSIPAAAAIADIPVGDDMFDVDQLIAQQGTVYLLGASDGATGPLTGALVAEIAYRAAQLAEGLPGGRLDPPMLLALDEVALVAPGPLDRWMSDMGGRGIVVDAVVQSLAWLEKGWGQVGGRIILNNAAIVLVGPGCKDPHDLAHWEALSGQREEIAETKDADGKVTSTTTRKVPVLTKDQIAAIPKFHAVVYGKGGISIIRTPNVFKDRKVRRAMKADGGEVLDTKYADQVAQEMQSSEEVTQ